MKDLSSREILELQKTIPEIEAAHGLEFVAANHNEIVFVRPADHTMLAFDHDLAEEIQKTWFPAGGRIVSVVRKNSNLHRIMKTAVAGD